MIFKFYFGGLLFKFFLVNVVASQKMSKFKNVIIYVADCFFIYNVITGNIYILLLGED